MKKLLIIIFFALFSISCEENETLLNSNEYIVFGHFYGECFGEQCIEIFKLESDQLFEDTLDKYPNYIGFYQGSFVTLSEPKLNLVKTLWDYFPEDLLSEQDTVFGCPDCRDQGGLYVEYSHQGIHKFWLFDNDNNDVPQKYHAFLDEVKKKIELLQ